MNVSYIYSIPYIVFLIYLLFICLWEFKLLNENKKLSIIYISCIVGFIFFFGLRGYVFTDWMSYYHIFQGIPTLWDPDFAFKFNDYVRLLEPGFIIYGIILKSFAPDYFCFQFLSSIIDIIFLHYFFRKYTSYYTLCFIFFILFSGFIFEINLMRNIKSLLLFMYSIKYIEQKNLKLFILYNLIGLSFHFSSIFFFPLYFFITKKISKKLIWSLFIVGNFIFIFQIKFIEPIAISISSFIGGKTQVITEFYLSSSLYGSSYGFTIGFLERTVTFIVLFLNYNKLTLGRKSNIIFLNIYLLYFCCFSFLSEATILLERVGALFIFSYWILYPELFKTLKILSNKFIFLVLISIYGVMKICVGNNTIMSEYQNILFGVKPYETRKKEVENYTNTID